MGLGERDAFYEGVAKTGALCNKCSAIIGREAPSPFAATYDGPPVLGRQQQPSGWTGPVARSRKYFDHGDLYEATAG